MVATAVPTSVVRPSHSLISGDANRSLSLALFALLA
jgi:hypothetical protein